MKNISRRNFLISATVASVGILNISTNRLPAVEPIKRSGKARLLPSLAAYSFRDYFIYGGSKKAPQEKRIDMFQFIDYCAENGCIGAELTSYYFPPNVNPDYMLKIKQYAFLKGIVISGTSVGNTFTHPDGEAREKEIANVKKWIDFAAIMGAPHIRVFAGSQGKNQSYEEAKKNCIQALEECAEYAGKKGVFLGLENHGGIVPDPQKIIDIINAVNSQWVGINLDSGNFVTDDPYNDIEKCAPYAVNVQIKVEIRRKGQKSSEPSDFKRLIEILQRSNYQGFVALEYEAAEDPYTAVPRYLKELAKLCSV